MSGCGIKTRLSKTDLKWVNVYNEGDTLIFRSDKGDLDTSFIIKKEIYYPDYNPVEVHGKYLPQIAQVWYKNKNLLYHPDGYKLVDIAKEHPRKKTSLTIDYLYSSVIISNLTNGNIEKYKHGKIYEFDTYHEKAKPDQPKKIFWHEDYGIIKYITHANEVWERINLPK
jgi:hypothetical protein